MADLLMEEFSDLSEDELIRALRREAEVMFGSERVIKDQDRSCEDPCLAIEPEEEQRAIA